MTQFDHEQIQELLGAYVLHAVEPDERAAVDGHLEQCPKCRAEVDELREVTAHLAQTGAPAPEGVWDRIADRLDGDDVEVPPLRLVAARPRRQAWLLPALAAAAVTVIAVLGAQRIVGTDDTPAEIAGAEILEAPDARQADLTSSDGDPLARAAVLPDGSGYLVADELPDLEAGVYQLWGRSPNGQVVSLGVLDGDGASIAFAAQSDVAILMITAEDAPVTATTNTPVVTGELV